MLSGVQKEEKSFELAENCFYHFAGNKYNTASGDSKRLEEALNCFECLRDKFNSGDSRYHYYIGCIHNKLKQYKEAVDSLKVAVSLYTEDCDYYLELGAAFGGCSCFLDQMKMYLVVIEKLNKEIDTIQDYWTKDRKKDNLNDLISKFIEAGDNSEKINNLKEAAGYLWEGFKSTNNTRLRDAYIRVCQTLIETHLKLGFENQHHDKKIADDNFNTVIATTTEVFEKCESTLNNKEDLYYNMGQAYYVLKQYDKVIEQIERIFKIHPYFYSYEDKEAKYNYLLGRAYFRAGNLNKATERLEISYRKFSNNFDESNVLYFLGRCWQYISDGSTALDYYKRALGKSEDPEIYQYRGMLYNRLERHSKARDDLEKAIAIYKQKLNEAPLYYKELLAESYKALGDTYKDLAEEEEEIENLDLYEKAINAYEEIEKYSPDAQECNFLANICDDLAGRYSKNEQHEKAAIFYKKASDISPDNSTFHAKLGEQCFKLGLYDEAIDELTKAIEENENTEYHNTLGDVYFKIASSTESKRDVELSKRIFGKVREYLPRLNDNKAYYNHAKDEYIKAINLNPGNAQFYLNLGRTYYYINDHKNAISKLEEGLKKNESAEDRNILGIAYFNLSDFMNAKKQFENAANINSEESVYYYNMGHSCLRLKIYSSAIVAFEKALNLNNNNIEWHRFYAYSFYAKRETQKAEAILINICSNQSNNNEYEKMADFFIGLKEYPIAIRALNRANELTPNNCDILKKIKDAKNTYCVQLFGSLEKESDIISKLEYIEQISQNILSDFKYNGVFSDKNLKNTYLQLQEDFIKQVPTLKKEDLERATSYLDEMYELTSCDVNIKENALLAYAMVYSRLGDIYRHNNKELASEYYQKFQECYEHRKGNPAKWKFLEEDWKSSTYFRIRKNSRELRNFRSYQERVNQETKYELSRHDTEIQDLEQKLDNDIRALWSEINEKQRQIDKTQTQIEGVKSQIRELSNRLDNTEDSIHAISSRVSENENQLKKSNSDNKEQYSKLQNRLEKLQQEEEEHKVELSTLLAKQIIIEYRLSEMKTNLDVINKNLEGINLDEIYKDNDLTKFFVSLSKRLMALATASRTVASGRINNDGTGVTCNALNISEFFIPYLTKDDNILNVFGVVRGIIKEYQAISMKKAYSVLPNLTSEWEKIFIIVAKELTLNKKAEIKRGKFHGHIDTAGQIMADYLFCTIGCKSDNELNTLKNSDSLMAVLIQTGKNYNINIGILDKVAANIDKLKNKYYEKLQGTSRSKERTLL